MVHERLNKSVASRLEELGLPSYLVEVGDFHEKFFAQGWLMFVRDRDTVADVHLIQPKCAAPSQPRVVASQNPSRPNSPKQP